MHRNAIGMLACVGLALCRPGIGRAQPDSARDQNATTPAEPSAPLADPLGVGGLDDGEVIIVEGDAPLDAGAASERTVGADELALTPGRSADDLLRVVPGLHIAQHASEGKGQQFFLRGFDAVHGSDLAVSVAGVPLNEPSNVHGHGYVDLGFVIPEAVLSLSAHKGSFTLAQGDFATAGSIAFELGVAPAQRGVRVGYEAGTTDRHRVVGVVAPASLEAASFAAIEAMRDAGFGQNRGSERVTALAQHRVRVAPGRRVDFLVAGYGARFGEPGTVPIADVEAGRLGFYDSYNPDGDGMSARALASAAVRDEQPGGAIEARVYAQWRKLRLAENFTGYLVHPERGDLRDQRHEAATIGGAAWWNRRVARRLELVLGVDARGDRLSQSEDHVDDDGAVFQRSRHVDATELAAGAAGGVRAGLGSRIRVEAGLRVDALWIRTTDRLGLDGAGASLADPVADSSDARAAGGVAMPPASDALTAVSPRLSLARTMAPGWTVFAAYGHGFRSPEARAVSPTAAADGDQVGPRFTTSRSAEIGAEGRAGRALTFGVTGFGVWISNEQVFDHLSGVSLARNATRRLGVEVNATIRPTSWLTARADATAVDARFVDSGSPVPGAPRVLVRGEAQARHGGWRAGGQVTYMGPRPLAHGARGEPFAVVDLLVGRRLGRIDLELQVDNLFDARWREGEFHYASRFDRDAPLSQIPRLHYAAGRPLGVRASLTVTL